LVDEKGAYMRAHCLQHAPFEGLGSNAPWPEAAGYEMTNTKFFESVKFPDLKKIDLLMIMGGPMSVNDEDDFPWLVDEKQFIRKAINSGKPVWGICLGAQLIASAVGVRVHCNPLKEIGWFPIEGFALNDSSIFTFPPKVEVLHWHGETFDLPAGAVHLAKSDGCENQVFQIGNVVIGLQFHMETTPQAARKIVSNCRDELVPAKYIQTEEEILSAQQERYKPINRLMDSIISFLLRKKG
jgi:GMP synthase-like glutamine amidotransferase